MYKLIRLIVKAKTVAKFATNTELVPKDESVLIVPTFTYSKNSFLGKVRAFFQEAYRLPSLQGISELPVAECLDGAEKHHPESIIPINLYRMCKIGGMIKCHFLKTLASLRGLAEKLWLL